MSHACNNCNGKGCAACDGTGTQPNAPAEPTAPTAPDLPPALRRAREAMIAAKDYLIAHTPKVNIRTSSGFSALNQHASMCKALHLAIEGIEATTAVPEEAWDYYFLMDYGGAETQPFGPHADFETMRTAAKAQTEEDRHPSSAAHWMKVTRGAKVEAGDFEYGELGEDEEGDEDDDGDGEPIANEP